MACSKTLEETIRFKQLSGSYRIKQVNLHKAAKMSKTRGGRITTSIRDRKKSLPLRHNAKERKIMKLRIIIPAYKEGRYLSSAAKTDHHKREMGSILDIHI